MEKNILLGVGITNAKRDDVLKYIVTGLQKPQDGYYIVTPNPEFLVYATYHPDFKAILNQARLALPDGVGVLWAGGILGKPFKNRITGADFMELLCKEVSEKPITVGFLGGGPGVAERTAECLLAKYPSLKVGFIGQEWPVSPSLRGVEATAVAFDATKQSSCHPEEVARSDRREDLPIRRLPRTKCIECARNDKNQLYARRYTLDASIDILFVAYGFPKQETFMAEHVGKIPVKVMMGVGGSFDYISGNISRAPLLVRKIGFEWLYRLIVQPWRIKRQLALFEFIFLVFKEKLYSLSF